MLLLFLIGIDFDFQHLKAHKGKPFVVSAVGITLPFALGLGVGQRDAIRARGRDGSARTRAHRRAYGRTGWLRPTRYSRTC